MGAIFEAMHVRLARALQDTQTTGSEITLATQDGKRRSVVERSEDLMQGRYFVYNLLRVIDREMSHGLKPDISFDASGFLDIASYDIINHREITAVETSVRYNAIVPVVKGSHLGFYRKMLNSVRRDELAIAVVNDNSAATRTVRLRLLKGSNVTEGLEEFIFDIYFYSIAKLFELIPVTGSATLTGTVSSSGVTLTATAGSSFTTDLMVGSVITVDGQTRTVASITSNLILTTTVAFSPAIVTIGAYTIVSQPDVVEARVWHPVIDAYALYLARISSDSDKAVIALSEAQRLALLIISYQYGNEAVQRVQSTFNSGASNG